MSDSEIEALADRIAARVVARLGVSGGQQGGCSWLPRRLTVEEFAACLQCVPEVARRYIRSNKHGICSKKHVSTERPYKVHPAALGLFGVTPEIALSRLRQFQSAHAPVVDGQFSGTPLAKAS